VIVIDLKFAPPQTALFLDLETTGIFPNVPGARILEIGMLAVEVPTFREIEAWSTTIANIDSADVLAGCDDYVRNMHTENGLKADLEMRPGSFGSPVALGPAQDSAIAFYNRHASGRRAYLAGANPDFDRRWLEYHMPNLARKFHYRGFDTNAFFILREYLFGAEKSGQKHRVLGDCRQAVQVVRDHFDLMKKLFSAKAGA
jgi:oligoribonuclease (3'-5' exoribonuclease)